QEALTTSRSPPRRWPPPPESWWGHWSVPPPPRRSARRPAGSRSASARAPARARRGRAPRRARRAGAAASWRRARPSGAWGSSPSTCRTSPAALLLGGRRVLARVGAVLAEPLPQGRALAKWAVKHGEILGLDGRAIGRAGAGTTEVVLADALRRVDVSLRSDVDAGVDAAELLPSWTLWRRSWPRRLRRRRGAEAGLALSGCPGASCSGARARGSSSIARPATLCWRSAARGAASLTCRAPRQRSTPRRCRCGRGAPQRCRPAGSRCRARSRGAPRFATGSRWRAVAAAGPCPGRAAWTSWRRTRDLPSTRPGSSGRGTWPSWGSGLCWRQAAAPLPSGRGQGCRSDSCSGEASWLAHSCCGLREMFLFYTSELCSKVITVVVGTCLGSKSMSW
ncbi:unnamed protein product, partial [Prorocentrum cordatum]